MKHYLSLSAVSVAAVIALAGCGAASDTSSGQNGATTESAAGVSAERNQNDVMFVQMMLPHHTQAVEMSEMVLAKEGMSVEVTDLATRIKDTQGPEIKLMEGWLKDWDEPAEPEPMAGHDMGGMDGMDGMMTDEQMNALDAASGPEAERLFLESMIEHHDGAVAMAEEQISQGKNVEVTALAQDIAAAQKAEIVEMRSLLEGL